MLTFLLNACLLWRIVWTCSEIYLDQNVLYEAGDQYEQIRVELFPKMFQHLTNEGIGKPQFVSSYSYAKRSPIWAYEKITAGWTNEFPDVDPKITNDYRIKNEAFIPNYVASFDPQYKRLPLIPYENHINGSKFLRMYSNHVLVKMSASEEEVWNDINDKIRQLVNEPGVKNMAVCTGTLFRSEEQKREHEINRLLNNLYANNDARKSVIYSKSQISYKILNGFAIPDALYKVYTYEKNDKKFLAMYVLPVWGSPVNADSSKYFWTSLSELEKLAGVYVFGKELNRFNALRREDMESECAMIEQYGLETFEEGVCEITAPSDEDFEGTLSIHNYGNEWLEHLDTYYHKNFQILAEHSLKMRENFLTSYNHKLLNPDWTIERIDRRKFDALDCGLKRPMMPSMRTIGIPDPFRPDDGHDMYRTLNRGPMAPACDHESINGTFIKTNAVPQTTDRNMQLWHNFEQAILEFFDQSDYKEMYIVSGPVYRPQGDTVKYTLFGRSQIAIPTHYFKAVLFLHANVNETAIKIVEMENKVYNDDNEYERLEKRKILSDFEDKDQASLERDVGFEIFQTVESARDTLISDITEDLDDEDYW